MKTALPRAAFPCGGPYPGFIRDEDAASPSLFLRENRCGSDYAAFFSPDNALRIFFIQAENRCRFCSRRTTASLVTQLN